MMTASMLALASVIIGFWSMTCLADGARGNGDRFSSRLGVALGLIALACAYVAGTV